MLERIERGKLTKAELAIKNKRLQWEENQKVNDEWAKAHRKACYSISESCSSNDSKRSKE
jgi:hypothetical protein